MDTTDLPYLTAEMPGIGGVIKARPDDFVVDEIPLYPPAGEGSHVFFRVRKTGIPTAAAIGRIAAYMGVKPHHVGSAGLKDAQAITTQTLSLEHADPDRLAGFRDSQVEILEISRHGNKLRPGHLAGNRFTVTIRQVGADALEPARAILDVLARRGVPNYFGPQRFGSRGDTAELGEALVRDEPEGFVQRLLGGARPEDSPAEKAARDAFDAGFLDRAIQRWPRQFADQRRALAAYKKGRKPARAISAIDKRMRRFYVSAFQSAIFNDVLARRVDSIDRLLLGDLAQKVDSGGVFRVEDLDAEQPRCDRFEISPTGPMPGTRCELAEGQPGQIERDALANRSVSAEQFDRVGSLKLKGTRRALRYAIGQPDIAAGSDEHGPYLRLTFSAPPGCYATVLLSEITKSPC